MNQTLSTKREISEASEKDRQRFWSKVERTAGCWWWRGGVAKGRGQFMLLGVPRQAHRVAYELVKGPLPPSVFLKHQCGELLCVNPAHMIIVGNAVATAEHGEGRPAPTPTPTLPMREAPRATPVQETTRPAERVAAADAPHRREGGDDQRPQPAPGRGTARPAETVVARQAPAVVEKPASSILPYAFGRELSGKMVHLVVDGVALCGQPIPPAASSGHVSFVAHRDCQGCALGLHRQGLRCAGCGKPFSTMTEQGVCPGCATAKRRDVDSHV